ncbi:hypothetical protein DdX_22230 [Ditylenchus destructor]|uniref:Uncharacterized protein n=1 Tax=Ditylenchus destructor TaxID=166010 RepID=A0AAD4QR04_9BILA|nr:hypothetical protein DdX_22230 [Ditylenchus destructor]
MREPFEQPTFVGLILFLLCNFLTDAAKHPKEAPIIVDGRLKDGKPGNTVTNQGSVNFSHKSGICQSSYRNDTPYSNLSLQGVGPESRNPLMVQHLLTKVCTVPENGHSGYHPDNTDGLDQKIEKQKFLDEDIFESLRVSPMNELNGGIQSPDGKIWTTEQKKLVAYAKKLMLSHYTLEIYNRSLNALKKKENDTRRYDDLIKQAEERLKKIRENFPGTTEAFEHSEKFTVLVLGEGNTLPPGKSIPESEAKKIFVPANPGWLQGILKW